MTARFGWFRRVFFGTPVLFVVVAGMLFSPLTVAAQPAIPPSNPPPGAQQIDHCPYVISSPGAYVLVADLTCPFFRQVAIIIASDDVLLWLNGHTISGPGRVGRFSVGIGSGAQSRIAIVGTGGVANFKTGIDFGGVHESVVARVTVTGTTIGVRLGVSGTPDLINESTNNLIAGNVLQGNGLGIVTVGASNNVFTLNTGDTGDIGIQVGEGTSNVVAANTARQNVVGIRVLEGSTKHMISGNSALGNSSVDLEDDNPGCDSNTWRNNLFGTANQPCIH